MWVINIKVPYNAKTLLGSIAKDNNVEFYGYPIRHQFKIFYIRMITSGQIKGSKENIANAIKDLKKSKRVFNYEVDGENIILDIRQHIANRLLFQAGIFLTKPAYVNNEGEYFFEVASWDRKKLSNIFKIYQFLNVELTNIQNKKLKNIEIRKTSSNLTDKQKEALNLAIKEGYYEFPRKIELKQLAKIMKISYTTYQYHLRHAENKIIPKQII